MKNVTAQRSNTKPVPNDYIVETSLFKQLGASDKKCVSACFLGLSDDISSKFPDEIKRQAWDWYSRFYGDLGVKYANLFLDSMKKEDWSKYDFSKHKYYESICDQALDSALGIYFSTPSLERGFDDFDDFDDDIPF